MSIEFEETARTTPHPAAGAFFGPFGLRAGWGLLLYLVLAGVLTFLAARGEAALTHQATTIRAQSAANRRAAAEARAHHQPPPPPVVYPGFAAIGESAQALGAIGAAALLAVLERRRFAAFGLPRRFLADAVPGALVGLAAMALLVGLLRLSGALVFDARLLPTPEAFRSGLLWLGIFALVGLGEEALFRGYIQFTLTRGLFALGRRLNPAHAQTASFWIAGLLLSALFFVAHGSNPGETPTGLAGVFLAGLLFTFALWRTGSLWWGIGFHTTWDWAQSFLFGVPDSGSLSAGRLFQTHPAHSPWLSGGVDGPEGSLLLLPVLLLVFLVLRLLPQRSQPPLEPTSLP